MNFVKFENKPSTKSPISANNLNHNFDEVKIIIDLLLPIGKIELFYDNEDHSDYMGFKWERTAIGKMPIGIDSSDTDFNTIGKTGGEKEHKLTTEEIPPVNVVLAYNNDGGSADYASVAPHWLYNGKDTLIFGKTAGGNQSHNNMPPYEVVALWKRIE